MAVFFRRRNVCKYILEPLVIFGDGTGKINSDDVWYDSDSENYSINTSVISIYGNDTDDDGYSDSDSQIAIGVDATKYTKLVVTLESICRVGWGTKRYSNTAYQTNSSLTGTKTFEFDISDQGYIYINLRGGGTRSPKIYNIHLE